MAGFCSYGNELTDSVIYFYFIYICFYLLAARQTGHVHPKLFCLLLFVNPKNTSMAAKWLRQLFVLGRTAIQNADRRMDKMADFSDCR